MKHANQNQVKLLLHACCGPCSMEPVRLLRERGIEPSIFYANSNIHPDGEYEHRLDTIKEWSVREDLALAEGTYDPKRWEDVVGRIGDAARERFGVIAGSAISDDVWKIDGLVEKPALEDAPSNLAVFGRYLLSARVMELLAEAKPTVGGEIQLTDALDAVLKEEEMYALVIDPQDGFDTGTVESWLETNNILFKRKYGKKA